MMKDVDRPEKFNREYLLMQSRRVMDLRSKPRNTSSDD